MIEWTSSYGYHKAQIGLLKLVVWYGDLTKQINGYRVRVEGSGASIQHDHIFEHLDEAKRAAIDIARQHVAKMAGMLEIAQENKQS